MASASDLIRDRKITPEERGLLKWLDSIEDEGKKWRESAGEDKDWQKYIDLMRFKRRANSDAFQADVIPSTLRRRNSLLTENKPNFQVAPRASGWLATAKTLTEIADAWWHHYDMNGAVEEMIAYATPMGSAGMSCPYDPTGDYGAGSCEPVVRDPRSVIIDPAVRRPREIDRAQYIRFESIMPLWEVQRQYPRGMLVKADGDAMGAPNRNIIGSPGRVRKPAEQKMSYKDYMKRLESGPIPRVRIKTYGIRDPRRKPTGEMVFPRGREIVIASDVVLADRENPNWDGLWDLDWFEINSDLDCPWGRSDVEALRYISRAVNRIGSMFVDNTILMGNSRLVYDHDALDPSTVNKLSNSAALIIAKKFGRSVDWQPPVPMPPHFLQFISFGLRLVDYLVGLADGQMEGKGRIEMRSGVQLEGLQAASQVLIRSAARRLEAFLERFGRKLVSRIFQYYQHDRMLLTMGQGDEIKQYDLDRSKLEAEMRNYVRMQMPDSIDGDDYKSEFQKRYRDQAEQTWQNFAFKVQPLSSLAATKVARAQLLMELAQAGMFPRSMVLEQIGFDNGLELMAKSKEEMQEFGPPPDAGAGKKKGGAKKPAAGAVAG